jgi:hypothetical protein
VGGMVAACLGAAQAQTLDLHGIGVSRDVPCKGLDVIVTGHGNQFRLTGGCGQVEVNGSEQQVSFGKAAGLVVTGVKNRIEGEHVTGLEVSGSEHQIETEVRGDDQQPAQIAIYGECNVLKLDLDGPTQIDVNGLNQQLTWRGDDPQIETTGVEHRIKQD